MNYEMTPELRDFIQKAIREGNVGGDGRSPFRSRQLHDLNRKPQADDPRPLFVWSAESPLDYRPGPYQEFPKLMWHLESHEEITVQDPTDQRMHEDLYTTMPPVGVVAANPMIDLQAAFEGLSEAEQTMILDAQRQDRIAKLQAKLAELPEAALEALLSKATEPKAKGRKSA